VYPYHSGIDSIVSIKYLVNEYADDEPNMKFTYDEKEFALHSYETKVLKYLDSYTSVSESIQQQTEAKEVQNLKFNEQGKPLYMKLEKSSSEMFNEEKTYGHEDRN